MNAKFQQSSNGLWSWSCDGRTYGDFYHRRDAVDSMEIVERFLTREKAAQAYLAELHSQRILESKTKAANNR